MNLNKVNHWLTLLANIGVLAGIVFLAIEIRNSSNAVTAQMQDSIADGFTTLNMVFINDPQVGVNWVIGLKKPDRLSDSEAIQFSMYMRALFNQYIRVHGMYKIGLLDESHWALYAREAATVMSSPGGKLHWEVNEMNPEFREDVERYYSQEPNSNLVLGRELVPK